jgi:hypothetical protein
MPALIILTTRRNLFNWRTKKQSQITHMEIGKGMGMRQPVMGGGIGGEGYFSLPLKIIIQLLKVTTQNIGLQPARIS